MLKELTVAQARFIALLAKTARKQRDSSLGNVPEEDLGEPMPARGEHNPVAGFGFEPASEVGHIRDAVAALSPKARQELYALTQIGQGKLPAKKLYRGLSEADRLGDDMITDAIIGDPDLHDHIAKALYETNMAA